MPEPGRDDTLSAQQLDALVEAVNIGFGKAASLVGTLVSSFISMSTPRMEHLGVEGLPAKIALLTGDRPINAVRQSFRGDFRGEHLFVVDDPAMELLHQLLDPQFKPKNERDEQDGLLEMSNIVCGALVGKLSEVIGARTTFSPPEILLWHEHSPQLLAGVPKGNDVCLLIHASFSVERLPVFRAFAVILLASGQLGSLGRSLDRFASGGVGS